VPFLIKAVDVLVPSKCVAMFLFVLKHLFYHRHDAFSHKIAHSMHHLTESSQPHTAPTYNPPVLGKNQKKPSFNLKIRCRFDQFFFYWNSEYRQSTIQGDFVFGADSLPKARR
jgi:hypothetical protein